MSVEQLAQHEQVNILQKIMYNDRRAAEAACLEPVCLGDRISDW